METIKLPAGTPLSVLNNVLNGETCLKCAARHEPKMYMWNAEGFTYHFNVEYATKLISKESVDRYIIAIESLREIRQQVDFDECHLQHVNMFDPIIFGQIPQGFKPKLKTGFDVRSTQEVRDWCDIGEVVAGTGVEMHTNWQILLDGSHRIQRAVRENIDLKGHIMTPKQTLKCLLGILEDDRKSPNSLFSKY